MSMLQSFFIPFFTTAIAELFDKSQFTIFLLATKTKSHMLLLLGALTAFLFVDGVAIVFGSILTTLIPERIISLAAAVLFFYFGITSLRKQHEEEYKAAQPRSPFFTALGVVFIAEWGDKTQLTSAVFATKYNPLLVFFAVLAAMTLLSLLAIYLGKKLMGKVETKTIHRIVGILFIILGLVFLFL